MISAAVAGVFVGSISGAVGETEWVSVTDSQELKKLVSGTTIDGNYFTHFYRKDGNMAYYYARTNSMTVALPINAHPMTRPNTISRTRPARTPAISRF
jgi:hypothetical protein